MPSSSNGFKKSGSTMNSYGPDRLILTGMTSKAPATIRGLSPLKFPGQRDSALEVINVKGNAPTRRTKTDPLSSGDFMSASARAVRAEGDDGGYIWLPQWIGGKMRVNEVWKMLIGISGGHC
jgi:hypothetical protein